MTSKMAFNRGFTIAAMAILALCVILPAAAGAADDAPPVGEPSVKSMQESFRALKFGMFIHFNMETYKNVQWVKGYASPADFNPGVPTIDTDAWADAAKAAGMKYAVLTVKHVSGFCLWDSKYTNYDVMNPSCPYKKDLVAQFVRSFRSRGLKVGFYYCWRSPGFGDPATYKVLPPECDPSTHSLKQQNEFEMKQIAELVEKYPDAFYIWNDGLDTSIMPAAEAKAFFRSLPRPILASSNWWGWNKKGTPFVDIAVKEVRDFPASNTFPGETCWTLQGSKWFWNTGHGDATPANKILPHIETAFARNSNFLLNVGPDKDGRIPESCVRVLKQIGEQLHP